MSDLRPVEMGRVDAGFSMGRVVGQTFGIIGRNFAAVGTVAFVVSALTIGLSSGIGFGLALAFAGSSALLAAPFLGGAVALVVRSIATGGITHIAVSDLNGEPVGIGPAFATGLRLAFPLLGLGIVVGLGVGLATLLLIVPGVMLAMRWLVAVPARVMEGPPIGSSLARSGALTKGSRWKLFGLTVALLVFSAAVSLLLGLVGGALGFGVAGSASVLIAGGAAQVIAGTITTSVSATGIAVCYMELRRLRDGATPGQLAAVFS